MSNRRMKTTDFANLIFEDTRKTLKARGMSLQGKHKAAIGALVATLTETLYGFRTNRASLCDLAPGMGKTTALVSTIRQVLKSPDERTFDDTRLADCGILICMNTLDEIEAVADQLGDMSSVYVWVGSAHHTSGDVENSEQDTKYREQCARLESKNQLSSPSEAQVLLTTHSRIEREFDGKIGSKDFSSITSLLYRGNVRRLKVWDESYLAGAPVSLPIKELRRHLPKLEEINREAAEALREITDLAEDAFNRSSDTTSKLFEFPNFWAGHGLDIDKLAEKWAQDHTITDLEATVDVFRVVEYLSNRTVAVRHDGNQIKEAFLTYEPTIPDSFLPVVVLDASGRKGIRKTYDLMSAADRLYRIEPTVIKRYDDFAIDVWRKGGGKSSVKNNFNVFLEGIAKWIAALPLTGETLGSASNKVLVIHHKPEDGGKIKKKHPKRKAMPDMSVELPRHMRTHYPMFDTSRLSFTTWGKHRGKNDWADHPFVVAAGTLFKPDSVYEATLRIASSKEPSDGLIKESDLKHFKRGEFADDLLQGLGRIRIRSSSVQGGATQCPPAKALVVAATATEIPEHIGDWFTGASVRDVSLVREVEIEGSETQAVADYLFRWSQRRDTCAGSTIAFRDINRALGISATKLKDTVRRSEKFKTFLRSINIVEYAEKKSATGYQLTANIKSTQDQLRAEREHPAVAFGFEPVA